MPPSFIRSRLLASFTMGKLNIFLFLTFLASVYTQCTVDRAQGFYKRSIYDFTVKLAQRIHQDTEGHFIASGLSPWNLLSTLSLGASHETLAEIARVLRMHPHRCFQEKFNEIARQITIFTNSTVLERSAAILVDRNLEVTSYFTESIAKAGTCNLETLDFGDPVSTAAYVNDLVRKATHEAIEEIVTSNDIEGASIIVIDALYFKGEWKVPFPYSDTEVSAFYDEKGNQIGDVNLMFVSGKFNLTRVKQLEAKVLELPYGDGDRFSMLILLPFPDKSISNVIDNLGLISLRTIFALFERRSADTVAVELPRFKISSDINNLKELLMDMGLRSMFDRSEARFETLAKAPGLFVSNLIQKAEVEVTEDGTVASAVSEAEFESRMLPASFVVNRPFVYMIVDKFVEIPVFIGAYSTPTVY